MKQILILVAALGLVACGSPKGKFVNACVNGAAKGEYNGDKASQEALCGCAYGKLADDLDGKQMSLATKLIGAQSMNDMEALANDMEGGAYVGQRVMAATKECAV